MQITDEEDQAIQMAEQAYNNEQAEHAYANIEDERARGVLVTGTEEF
jgi:hypothetical protein